MGISPFKVSSSYYDTPSKVITKIVNNNPNPLNYKVVKTLQIKNFLIIKIRYPDCKNYEGYKILVYKDCVPRDLIKQRSIDPHFSKNKKFKSPFARFEPTISGWKAAIILVNSLIKK